jgi:hypothetical protein
MHAVREAVMARSKAATRTRGELEDEIEHLTRRVEELRQQIDEERDLVTRMTENVEDADGVIEHWKEAFEMVLTDDNKWSWGPYLKEAAECKIDLEWQRKEHNALVQKHNDLVRKWNMKMLGGQPVGRPLGASRAQIAQVLELRNDGMSLRAIADETSLGLNTVRTIVDKKHNVGRAARRARQLMRKMHTQADEAWEVEAWEIPRDKGAKQKARKFKRQKQTLDALPKQAQRVVEEGRALIKEAKGLGRS